MAYALVVRTAWDNTTTAMSQWANLVVQMLLRQGKSVKDVQGAQVLRHVVESELNNTSDLVIFYGHGESDRLKGHKSHNVEEVVIDSQNSQLLKDKIVYVVACDSAQVLGHDAVAKGAIVYIGYGDFYGFYGPDPRVRDIFRVCSNRGIIGMIQGESAKVGFDSMYQEYESWIQFYGRGAGMQHPRSWTIFSTLFWDQQHLEIIGNHAATMG